MMFKLITVLVAVFAGVLIEFNLVEGHGMLLDPPSRSSRWRYDSSAPKNYDDNALYCGGYATQWGKNGGKCGLCGDDYSATTPRDNELGGKYGEGVITKTYTNAYTAYLGIRITANHLGFFYFHLCNLDESGAETEACYNKYRLSLVDGSDKLYIGSTLGWVNATVVFPEGVSCNHCVLRWSYQGGNNWGFCEDGSGALGCGPQENFKGCADISITAAASRAASLGAEVPEVVLEPVDEPDYSPYIPESI